MHIQAEINSQFNTIALELVNLSEKRPLLTRLPSLNLPIENK